MGAFSDSGAGAVEGLSKFRISKVRWGAVIKKLLKTLLFIFSIYIYIYIYICSHVYSTNYILFYWRYKILNFMPYNFGENQT